MSHGTAEAIVLALLLYAGIGLLFAIAFASVGARRIDPVAAGSTWGFKLLILPGAAALWPYLLLRWARRDAAPPTERSAHRDAAESLT